VSKLSVLIDVSSLIPVSLFPSKETINAFDLIGFQPEITFKGLQVYCDSTIEVPDNYKVTSEKMVAEKNLKTKTCQHCALGIY
jgi:hypothetical protein